MVKQNRRRKHLKAARRHATPGPLSVLAMVCALSLPQSSLAYEVLSAAKEKCYPRYRDAGAEPGTGFACEIAASQADGGMGGYMCPGDSKLIDQYCKGDCEVEPLQPITDPEALEMENGDKIREDKLSESMSGKLKCLRDKVAEKGGTLTVTSAWRPQSYQDHLVELVTKHPKLIRLAWLENVKECRPAPYYGAVHPEHVKHQLGHQAAVISKHTDGEAFDANSSGVKIDTLAGECGLYRPLPKPFNQGGDPVHFTHKPEGQEMGRFVAMPLIAAASFSQAATLYTPEELGLTVVADGVHVITNGVKQVKYTYTVSNVSGELVRGIIVGKDTDTVSAGVPVFLLKDEGFAMDTEWVNSPSGWTGEIGQIEETTDKMLQWLPTDQADKQFGIRPGQSVTFSLRTHTAFPSLVNTRMMIPFKTFKYYEPPVIQLKPLDKIAPTLSTVLSAAPARNRPGYLKVTAKQNGYDAHDPHPEILLDRVESNQVLGPKDIDAEVGTETNVFFVKQVPGRTYTVTYKALDASGNFAMTTNTITASP